MISIVIPTIKSKSETQKQEEQIKSTINNKVTQIYYARGNRTAAENRNICIAEAKNDLIIMLDDDISGFYDGWVYDLIFPYELKPNGFSIISARLCNNDGTPAQMLGGDRIENNDIQIAVSQKLNIVCGACIAFFKDGIFFDQNYKGATYEDTDFCMAKTKKNPEKIIIINNRCKLIHTGEMKNRNNEIVTHNRNYFNKKWNTKIG